jgi:hypothetical protein
MNDLSVDIDVERIVNEVLAQLGVAACAPRGERREERGEGKRVENNARGLVTSVTSESPKKDPISLPPTPTSSNPSPKEPNTLVLEARVVTMREVQGRLDGARRVLVARDAIVTPAVRDELIRRGIALECGNSASNASAAVRLAMVVSGTDFEPDALAAALVREGFQVESSASD